MLSEKAVRMGDKAKPLAEYRPTALLFLEWTAGDSSLVLHERGSEAAGFGHHFDPNRLSDRDAGN